MKKLKKWIITSGLFSLLLFLSGCVKTDSSGVPTGEGFMYNLLVKPMGNLITYLAVDLGLDFGLAIIVLTIIVRIIIMPLGLSQMKKAMVQQEKMAAVKPHMDAINKKMAAATDSQEKMAAQMELQSLYKENDISLVGGLGCLPLLIQMPIFTALFFAAKVTPGIAETNFLNMIPLGKPSYFLVALAGLIYLGQSFISMIGMPEEQKKQMKMMTFMSPLMIVMVSFKSPAGVTLYWVVSGTFGCIQSLITNLYHKPKVKKQLAEHFEKNPIKVSPVSSPGMKDVTPEAPKKQVTNKNNNTTNGSGRNAGKQIKK